MKLRKVFVISEMTELETLAIYKLIGNGSRNDRLAAGLTFEESQACAQIYDAIADTLEETTTQEYNVL